jgi:hypothetical protein
MPFLDQFVDQSEKTLGQAKTAVAWARDNQQEKEASKTP